MGAVHRAPLASPGNHDRLKAWYSEHGEPHNLGSRVSGCRPEEVGAEAPLGRSLGPRPKNPPSLIFRPPAPDRLRPPGRGLPGQLSPTIKQPGRERRPAAQQPSATSSQRAGESPTRPAKDRRPAATQDLAAHFTPADGRRKIPVAVRSCNVTAPKRTPKNAEGRLLHLTRVPRLW